jgi:hypothetical protein
MLPSASMTYQSRNMGMLLDVRHSVRATLTNPVRNEGHFKIALEKISQLQRLPTTKEYIRRENAIQLSKSFGEALQVCINSQRALDSSTVATMLRMGGTLDRKYEFYKILSPELRDERVCNSMLRQAQRDNNLSIAWEVFEDAVMQGTDSELAHVMMKNICARVDAIAFLNRSFPQGPGDSSNS